MGVALEKETEKTEKRARSGPCWARTGVGIEDIVVAVFSCGCPESVTLDDPCTKSI